jgi:hypothetical protein
MLFLLISKKFKFYNSLQYNRVATIPRTFFSLLEAKQAQIVFGANASMQIDPIKPSSCKKDQP